MWHLPNSPDLNILDLGFFNAIQTLQHEVCPKTTEELISAVENSFDEYSSKHVNRIFLTLQSCKQEIMKVQCSNNYKISHLKKAINYKISHLKKAIMEKEGNLPSQMSCDRHLVRDVMNYLAT